MIDAQSVRPVHVSLPRSDPGRRSTQIGPYRLEELLGAGSMGEVYRAWDERLEREVALKHVRPEAERSSQARARFLREARAAARLNHPAIVRIYDILEWDGHDWLVMELVEGETLARRLPLPPGPAAALAAEVAEGLAVAHAAGILHRDLKTENLVVTPDGHAKILDFGVAKRLGGAEEASLSVADAVVGTPRAMSPEQTQGRELDPRSDLFSLGTLLYETLTGSSPFVGPGLVETLRKVCTHRQAPVREGVPAVPRELSDLVDRLLEKDPAHRPQTASEVARELRGMVPEAAARPPATASAPAETLGMPTIYGHEPTRGPVRLRVWPPPELPERPYPVLLPYRHPELLAGRERELAQLRRLLSLPIPVLGLHASSGAGKSSLLAGGLVPTLRAAGRAVAFDRRPHEPGLCGRLLRDLLADLADAPEDAEEGPEGFVGRLREIRQLTGEPPILVLDQIEGLLDPVHRRPRALLGLLLAASAVRQPGFDDPPCRWLLAYRREYHGDVLAWLGDALSEAEAAGSAVHDLPGDLSGPDRFHDFPLPTLGTPPPGAVEPLAEAVRAFRRALEKPLEQTAPDGRPRYLWRFEEDAAERLARAFAEARLERPDAPLTPELQVMLAHLMAQALPGDPGEPAVIAVPNDPGLALVEALDRHLDRALEAAFPGGGDDARRGRARALLALRELADAHGRRREGLSAADLSRAVGEGGAGVLERLSGPTARLLVLHRHPEGWRYALAHDRLAEVIVRRVDREHRRHGIVDPELLALRRLVALKTALHRSGEEQATRLPRRRFRQVEAHAEALVWGDDQRAWWTACRRRRHADRRRTATRTAIAAVLLAVATAAVWAWASRRQDRRALREQIATGEPAAALAALERLAAEPGIAADEARGWLRRRERPLDVLERGLGEVPEDARGAAALRTVELAQPLLTDPAGDVEGIASALWALDFFPARDARHAAAARAWRDRLLAPWRQRQPPPPPPEPGDRDWVAIPAGDFLMGGDEPADAAPRHRVTLSAFRIMAHEVTRQELRRLFPDPASAAGEAGPGDGDLPAAGVSWYAAYLYAAWLGGRLPTEAEWEYAARAGCRFEYCTRAAEETTLGRVGWHRNNASDPVSLAALPHPVARLEPNPWGLFDVFGNVWEWTADLYGPYEGRPQRDPIAAVGGGNRVLRGGGYWSPSDSTRAAYRLSWPPDRGLEVHGFRVVLPAKTDPE